MKYIVGVAIGPKKFWLVGMNEKLSLDKDRALKFDSVMAAHKALAASKQPVPNVNLIIVEPVRKNTSMRHKPPHAGGDILDR